MHREIAKLARCLIGDQLVKHRTQREDIGTHIERARITGALLGTHVQQRPHNFARLSCDRSARLWSRGTRESKVNHFDHAVVAHQDV